MMVDMSTGDRLRMTGALLVIYSVMSIGERCAGKNDVAMELRYLPVSAAHLHVCLITCQFALTRSSIHVAIIMIQRLQYN